MALCLLLLRAFIFQGVCVSEVYLVTQAGNGLISCAVRAGCATPHRPSRTAPQGGQVVPRVCLALPPAARCTRAWARTRRWTPTRSWPCGCLPPTAPSRAKRPGREKALGPPPWHRLTASLEPRCATGAMPLWHSRPRQQGREGASHRMGGSDGPELGHAAVPDAVPGGAHPPHLGLPPDLQSVQQPLRQAPLAVLPEPVCPPNVWSTRPPHQCDAWCRVLFIMVFVDVPIWLVSLSPTLDCGAYMLDFLQKSSFFNHRA